MLYDLASSPPEPGSLLESLFLLVSMRRREAELYQTEVLLTSIIGSATGDLKQLEKAFKAYRDVLFPFLGKKKIKDEDFHRRVLKEWAGKMAFRVRPLWAANVSKKMHSQLRKGAERTMKAEELRRQKHHRRME